MKDNLSIPDEFKKLINEQLGNQSELFFELLNVAPHVSIRVNPKKESAHSSVSNVPWSQFGKYLNERPIFTLDPLIHAGAYYVQEASSMFLEQAIVNTFDLSKNIIALDLCAAPGGKSTHLLSLLSAESLLISNEVIRSRVSILSENVQKWGYPNVMITSNDPEDFASLESHFDLIVVDAPCSGEGLFRKNPNAMQHWSMDSVKMCAARQQRILKNTWPALKPGGVLIYSTCTFNSIEDEANMEWLANNGELEFENISLDPNWGVQEIMLNMAVGYKFYPHRVKGEGFFISVVRKKGSPISDPKLKTKFKFNNPLKEEAEILNQWTDTTFKKSFIKNKEQICFAPSSLIDEMAFLMNRLNVISAGTPLAISKHGKLVPEHAGALSIYLKRENFQNIELNEDEAKQYLKKGNLILNNNSRGFALVTYKGFPLGWVNLLGNRFNNLYPANWRIRME